MWKSQTLHCKFPNRGTNKCYLSSNILVGVPFYKFINNSVMGNQAKKVEDTFHSQPCLSFCTIPFHLKGCFCAFRGQAFPDSSKKDTRLWRGFFFPPDERQKLELAMPLCPESMIFCWTCTDWSSLTVFCFTCLTSIQAVWFQLPNSERWVFMRQ